MKSRLTIASVTRDIVVSYRGFNVAADILTNTADGVSLNDLRREFSSSLAEGNKTRDAISALFTRNTMESFTQLPTGSRNIKFQKQSEFGVPQASRVSPDYARVRFPLNWSDAGLRYRRKFHRDATAQQVRVQRLAVLGADTRATFRDTPIREHGHGLRESGEQLIVMVNPAQMDEITSWRKASPTPTVRS